MNVGEQAFHVLYLAKRSDIDLVIELATLVSVSALTILAYQQKSSDENCFDRKNDSKKSERINVEHRRERDESGIHSDPQQEPECVYDDEIGIANEAGYSIRDSLVNARFTSDLLFGVTKFSQRLVARRVRAKDSVGGILAATLRANYQIRALILVLLTMGSPSLQPKAFANSGMLDSGPFTRN